MNELEKIFYDLEQYLFKAINSMFKESQLLSNFNNLGSNLSNVSIKEKNNTIDVKVEIPGLTKEHQLKVDVDNDRLILYGNLDKHKKIKSDNGGMFTESYSEYFYRTVPLPKRVTKKGAKAVFENGSLKISLNKLGELEDRTKYIDIDYR